MRIGEKTIATILEQIEGLMRDHQTKLNKALNQCDDPALAITFKAKVEPTGGDSLKIETGIAFIMEKVADKSTPKTVSEVQVEMELVNKNAG